MPVPDFQSFFKPLLEIATDGKEHSLKEARKKIAEYFNLTDEDRAELLPSGNQTKFDNRVAWAKSYFVQAKVLESPRRAYFKITDRGKELLAQGHERIDVKVLNQYPEFVEFHTPSKQNKSVPTPSPEGGISETPEEVLQKAYQSIRSDLAGEILERIKSNSPAFFENLVIDLMVAMGYGGSRVDAGQLVGQSGDEGIDGIIKEDRLGLDVIYLQAKRWEGTVGRPEIQKFVGALHGKRAKKGVFITTGKFSEEAHEYVKSIDPKVILIDGRAFQMISRRKPTHPGEILREDIIKPLGLTVTDAAKCLGVTRKTLSALINCKASVSPEMAVRIAKATRTSPESWLYMQTKLDLWLVERKPTQVEEFGEIVAA